MNSLLVKYFSGLLSFLIINFQLDYTRRSVVVFITCCQHSNNDHALLWLVCLVYRGSGESCGGPWGGIHQWNRVSEPRKQAGGLVTSI